VPAWGRRPEGLPTIPDHTSIGIAAGPLFGTTALLAGVLHARQTGEGCHLEVAQSDASAAFDWLRITALRAAGALGPAKPE
jgi:crotonobetainyl-CoA:carnitine CoA-transferase CaiB-like acyl-CoA transferase